MQLSLFGGTTPFKIDKPIRLIELFGGISCQAQALLNLGVDFENYRYCDFDKYACQSHNEIMQTNDKPSDITKWKGEDLGICDTDKYCYIMTYSFPCGLAGTKIATKNGYKNIENITTKDYVLTHNNRFCQVKKTMSRISDHYYRLKGLGVPKLYLTGEHPLYVYRDNKFQWIKVKDLSLSDKFSFNINQNSIDVELSKEYLWLLGRYVADGHINKYSYNSVNFSISFNKEQQFLENIPSNFIPRFKKFRKKVWDYRIADKQLKNICLEFKTGSLNKEIPQWIIDLPKEKLKSFFDGYISGDGHVRKRNNSMEIMFSTVSEKLFLGLQQIIAKLYHRICSCYIRKDKRKETFNDSYDCQFILTDNEFEQKVIDDKIITNIKKIEKIETDVPVYNLEIDKDNSYTCQNVITHNCTDLSTAGKMAGMERGSGTRSGLLWEVERLLKECNELPQVLLMENVPQVHGKKNKASFDEWCQFLESLGYKNYWKDLNAKDYGVPQSRNRCFMVSLLGDYSYQFPKPIELKLKLQDLLEDEVDEKYYISDKMVNYISAKNDKWFGNNGDNSCINRECACTKTTREGQIRADTSDYICKNLPVNYKLNQVAQINDNLKTQLCNKLIQEGKVKENDVIRHSYSSNRLKNGDKNMGRIENHEGLSPTLDTRCDCLGVCVKTNNKRQRELANKIDLAKDNQFLDFYNQSSQTNIAGTITTRVDASNSTGIYKDYRIRKLTPTECLRLMGVRDEYSKRITCSNAQKYKQAGNGIVVDVLMVIFKQML